MIPTKPTKTHTIAGVFMIMAMIVGVIVPTIAGFGWRGIGAGFLVSALGYFFGFMAGVPAGRDAQKKGTS